MIKLNLSRQHKLRMEFRQYVRTATNRMSQMAGEKGKFRRDVTELYHLQDDLAKAQTDLVKTEGWWKETYEGLRKGLTGGGDEERGMIQQLGRRILPAE